MNLDLLILILAAAIAAIAFMLLLLDSASARTDEFDGGFEHDHGTRITRVRSNFIINDGDNS